MPQPTLTHALGDGTSDDSVHALHGGRRVRAARATDVEQMPVEAAQIDRRQLCDPHGPERGSGRLSHAPTGDFDRPREKAGGCVLKPLFEQPAKGRLVLLPRYEAASLGDEFRERANGSIVVR